MKAADEAKNVTVAQEAVVGGILANGSITAAFERKGKGKVTYSHRQHTKTEAKYVTSFSRYDFSDRL